MRRETPDAPAWPLESRVGRRLATVLLVLAALWFFNRSVFWPRAERLWDYSVFVSGAEIWFRGGDPYDDALVYDRWIARRPDMGVVYRRGWVQSNAPPSTYALLSPFGIPPIVPAAAAYVALTSALMAYAFHRMAVWAGISEPTSRRIFWAWLLLGTPLIVVLKAGNPAALAVPLTLIGLERARRTPGVLAGALIGLGVAAKVQVAFPLAIFAAFCGLWRSAAVAAVVWLAVLGVGIARLEAAGVDWRAGMAANIAATNLAGGMNDYTGVTAISGQYEPHRASDLLAMQVPLWQLTWSRPATEAAAWALFLVGAAALAALMWRRRDAGGPATLVGLGTAGALSLVPVYHRTYDALVLVPLLAASCAALASADRRMRWLAVATLACSATFWLPVGAFDALAKLPPIRLSRGTLVSIKPWAILAQVAIGLAMLSRLKSAGREASGLRAEVRGDP